MILVKCDLCNETRRCTHRQIDDREYDICPECWNSLMAKLKGKGRPKRDRELVTLPSASPDTTTEKPQPFPGKPPDIIAGSQRAN